MCYQVLSIYSLDETNLYLDSTFLITFIKIRNCISILVVSIWLRTGRKNNELTYTVLRR